MGPAMLPEEERAQWTAGDYAALPGGGDVAREDARRAGSGPEDLGLAAAPAGTF